MLRPSSKGLLVELQSICITSAGILESDIGGGKPEGHRVYICFSGMQNPAQKQKLIDANQGITSDDVKLADTAPQTVGLVIEVPPVIATEPFADQKSRVWTALKAVYRLSILLPVAKVD